MLVEILIKAEVEVGAWIRAFKLIELKLYNKLLLFSNVIILVLQTILSLTKIEFYQRF